MSMDCRIVTDAQAEYLRETLHTHDWPDPIERTALLDTREELMQALIDAQTTLIICSNPEADDAVADADYRARKIDMVLSRLRGSGA